jgi:hypothetical protein
MSSSGPSARGEGREDEVLHQKMSAYSAERDDEKGKETTNTFQHISLFGKLDSWHGNLKMFKDTSSPMLALSAANYATLEKTSLGYLWDQHI